MKAFGSLLTLAVALVAAESGFDPVAYQLPLFKNKTQGPIGIITTTSGAPVSYDQISQTLNHDLLDNEFFMEHNVHYLIRERTPERVVHAMGTGAFGYYKVTEDISHICKADFLNGVGKKTPIAVRFSMSAGNRGSSEYEMETRGFAIKFNTLEGIFDIPGFNTAAFSFKDPMHSHAVIHAPRRNPATNCFDPTMQWDMFTQLPQTMHMMLYIFSGRGLPASYRKMPGWGIHTYQVVNKEGEIHFVRFKFEPEEGIENLTAEEAEKLRGSDPNYLTKELYRSIEEGKFPKWHFYIQHLTREQAEKLGSDAIDVTRTLPEDQYPWKKIGEFVLNRNPTNHFAQIEQLAFCPCNLVPGILGGSDKLYQARRLIYKAAQLHRLGKNVNNIPVNCPFRVKNLHTYIRDGLHPFGDNGGDAPNYYPNSFNGLVPSKENASAVLIKIKEKKADNFDQARDYYANGMTADERATVVKNVAASLKTVSSKIIVERAVTMFTNIHPDLGSRIAKELNLTE